LGYGLHPIEEQGGVTGQYTRMAAADNDYRVRLQRMSRRTLLVVNQSKKLLEQTRARLKKSKVLSEGRIKMPDISIDQTTR
jgi:hypothetical protein